MPDASTGDIGRRDAFHRSGEAVYADEAFRCGAFAQRDCPYFNLSERSFQRRLAELGTNLNEIKDAIRKNAGFKLLVESDLPVSDISYRRIFDPRCIFPLRFPLVRGNTYGYSPETRASFRRIIHGYSINISERGIKVDEYINSCRDVCRNITIK